jgi:hypothetical protein
VVGKEHAREVFLNDDFSFKDAIADKFDAAGMIGIHDIKKYERLTTIITRHLTPNLNVFNKRANEQVIMLYHTLQTFLRHIFLICYLQVKFMLDKLVGPAEGMCF